MAPSCSHSGRTRCVVLVLVVHVLVVHYQCSILYVLACIQQCATGLYTIMMLSVHRTVLNAHYPSHTTPPPSPIHPPAHNTRTQVSPLEMVYKQAVAVHKELLAQHDPRAALVNPSQLLAANPGQSSQP